MSNQTLINYYFTHLRRGQGAELDFSTVAENEKRPQTTIKFRVETTNTEGQIIQEEVKQKIALYGPGDVLGFDTQKMVVRVQPTQSDGNFLANDIPFIEFAEPDFLWRYSSDKVDADKWIPWLSMIILKPKEGDQAHEFEWMSNSPPELPPRIKLTADAALPDLKQSWRWAHVYCTDAAIYADQVPTKVATKPGYAISRLICPRRLKRGTKYCAFIVPTYKLGWEAGLGIQKTTTNRKQLSWDDATTKAGMEIPYYYKWEFRTGLTGDFEQVLRQLEARPISGLAGQKINIENPGYGLKHQGTGVRTTEVEGALQSSEQNDLVIEALDGEEGRKLADLLNSSIDENGELRVVPPIYGRWINYDQDDEVKLRWGRRHSRWLDNLNLDPRCRIAAGLGVQYIKDHQEELMASAWEQLKTIQTTNHMLNLGRFGRAVSKCLHKRITSSKDQALEMAGAADTAFKVLKNSNERTVADDQETLKQQLKDSEVPNTINHVKARKYYGQLRRRTRQEGRRTIRPLKENSLRVGGVVKDEVQTGGLVESANKQISPIKRSRQSINLDDITHQVINKIKPANTVEKRFCDRIERLRKWEERKKSRNVAANNRDFENDPLRPITGYPEFHVPMYKYLLELSETYLIPGVENIPQNTVSALISNRKFIESFMIGLNHEFAAELRWREYPTDLRGSYFRKFWDTTIYSVDEEERKTFRTHPIGIALQESLDLEWEKIEDAINHADQAEVAEKYEEAIERWLLTRDEDKDIAKLFDPKKRIWKADSRLGTHSVNGSMQEANELVLVIRADVLKKFPNTVIYLAQKTFNDSFLPLKEFKPIYPIFEANLPPDVICLGFPMSEAQARRHYIVFEERQSQQRFGLDVDYQEVDGAKEENLSWAHFNGLDTEGYLDEISPAGNDASGKWDNAAYIPTVLLQKPVRLAIDLDTLLP